MAAICAFCLHRKNNISEYVADQRCGFPTELFKTVNGEKLFVDERYMVMRSDAPNKNKNLVAGWKRNRILTSISGPQANTGLLVYLDVHLAKLHYLLLYFLAECEDKGQSPKVLLVVVSHKTDLSLPSPLFSAKDLWGFHLKLISLDKLHPLKLWNYIAHTLLL